MSPRVGLRSARGDLHFADKVEYRPVSVLVLGVAKAAVIAALHGDQSIRRTQAFMQCGGLLKGHHGILVPVDGYDGWGVF